MSDLAERIRTELVTMARDRGLLCPQGGIEVRPPKEESHLWCAGGGNAWVCLDIPADLIDPSPRIRNACLTFCANVQEDIATGLLNERWQLPEAPEEMRPTGGAHEA